jgi:hydrogenase/urease accessory protein HupE
LLGASVAPAHEVRPAYLELHQGEGEVLDVLWKVPARGEYSLAIDLRLPDQCVGAPGRPTLTGSMLVERWQARCAGGVIGGDAVIEGLGATRTDVLVRYVRLDGSVQVARLTPDQPVFRFAAAPVAGEVARAYLWLGIEHILLGPDHLLFVLGLLLLVAGWRRLLWTITAFTIAHSITLVTATLGIVRVPAAPVEAVIALSVMFVALEVLHARSGRPGYTTRAPWAVAFAFGLLHGLGFAGALAGIGLPEGEVPLALLFFNVGVELGQLVFVGGVLGLLWLADRYRRQTAAGVPGPWGSVAPLRLPLAYGIGSISAYWLLDRVAGFWA